jgi:FlaA1/EpsC-like NDP-sugar epimerase
MKLSAIFRWLDPVVIASLYLLVNVITDPTFVGLVGFLPLVEIGFVYGPIIAFRYQQRLWDQASIHDIIDYVKVIIVSALGIIVVTFIFAFRIETVYFVGLASSYLFISRFSARFISVLRQPKKVPSVVIYGAGEAGSQLFKTLQGRKHVVAFFDDDVTKAGYVLHGKPVQPVPSELSSFVKQHQIKEVFIAIPTLRRLDVLQKAKPFTALQLSVQVLPSFENVSKKNYQLQPKPIEVEEVLGRDVVELDLEGLEEFLTNQVVLITGAGGSIGSELARQVAKYPIKQLILLDHTENGLFFIAKELQSIKDKLLVRIASIQDEARIDDIFNDVKPTLIYHAAAHKHVGLMEDSPIEAIKNNIIGSYHVMNLAMKHKVKQMVTISTDKAVRPTNVMGASKQVVERIMQTVSKDSPTIFSAVRFGNVLGSNGSVIPIFEAQIAKGGPVTVTDPNVKRYFMTIPEAVQLVMETSLYAENGNIFILDMGEPVLIKDLAETMIRLAGFEPYQDIDIAFTGLQPGEKMFEELILNEDQVVKTPNQKIFLESTPLEPVDITKIKDISYGQSLIDNIINEVSDVS